MQHNSNNPFVSSSSSGGESGDSAGGGGGGGNAFFASMVAENAIIVFGRRECYMCHVAQRLLFGLGVNPTIYGVDEEDEVALAHELAQVVGCSVSDLPEFPAVFIGGKMFGGLEKLIGAHISGELVPMLRQAGALWL